MTKKKSPKRSKEKSAKRGVGKKPFAKKPSKIPKKSPKKKKRGKYPTNRKSNLSRVVWREFFGTGQKFRVKDWSQKAMWIIFAAIPSLIVSGSVFWINRWNGTKNFYLKWTIFPFFVLIIFTVNILILVLWIQAMLFGSIVIIFLFSLIILWWVHKGANYLRIGLRDWQRSTKAYRRLYPNSPSANRGIPRVTPRKLNKKR